MNKLTAAYLIQLTKEELKSLPTDWSLVPVMGKQPIGKGWNKRPLTPEQLSRWIACGHHCTGFGLLTGTPIESGCSFVLAVDQDGIAAAAMLSKLARGKLPLTIAFSSGRPGRCQWLFKVSASVAQQVRSHKLEGGLELRFAGLMSVLPPSIHPSTGKPYRWLPGCSPSEVEIALAPDWLVQLMIAKTPTKTQLKQSVRQVHNPKTPRVADSTIASLLARLNPHRADDYHEWIKVGMALRSYSNALLHEWDSWSRQSPKYQSGECEVKWQTFNPTRITIGTLYYLAQLDSSSLT